jgi:Mrp family chromosome partitioning ATPase
MSRNFELLQSISGTADTSGTPLVSPSEPLEPQSDPEDIPTSLLVAKRPSTTVPQTVREEIAKLIHTIFPSPSGRSGQPSRPNAVVLCGFEAGKSEALLTAITSDVLSHDVPEVRVCAVDANFAHPAVHKYFAIAKSPGLAEALHNPEATHRFTRRVASNLWVMCSAGWPLDVDGQAEMTPQAVATVMEKLKKSFGFILINGGCATDSATSITLGQAGCGIVLVIEADSTRHSIAEKYKHTFIRSGINVLGAVLHKPNSSSLYSFHKTLK